MKSILLLALVLVSCTSQGRGREEVPTATASTAGALQFQMVPLQFASAEELAGTLRELVRSEAGPRTDGVKVLSDARTNSLLLQAPEDEMSRLLEIVAKLDVRAEPPAAARR
jgi:type II secretory pathway component GspD/PulD (secretin)